MGNVFTCSFCFVDEAGVAQLVERQPGLGTKLIIWRALGPEAAGSNPAPGTTGLSLIPFIRSASFEQSSVKMNFRLRTEPELAERLSLSTG